MPMRKVANGDPLFTCDEHPAFGPAAEYQAAQHLREQHGELVEWVNDSTRMVPARNRHERRQLRQLGRRKGGHRG